MDPRHQKFAELLALGTSAGPAYAEAYSKPAITASVAAAGRRLATQSHIAAKVQSIREKAAIESEAATVLSLQEKRQFLARIVRTPVTLLDPDDKSTHDLIKKVSIKVIGSGENLDTTTEVEGYDKIKAIVEDTNLAGDGAESDTMRVIGRLLGDIPRDGMILPTDKM